jgi:hypothetical protein
MKNICLVNGSLSGKKSASLQFLRDIDLRLSDGESRKAVVGVRAKLKDRYPEEALRNLAEADAIIFVFPLHNYGLPGALMRLLEDYYDYTKQGVNHKASSIYMVVNCGFPRSQETCGEAIRVMQNFCRRLSLKWRFALCIGTGPVVVLTKKVPFLYPKLKKAYTEIVSDIRELDNEKKNNYFIKPIIPESIIAAIKRRYEKKGKMIPSDNSTVNSRK